MEVVVNENIDRIDKYLAANTEYTRTTLNKLLNNDYILVNGNPVKASYKVKIGDVIKIDDSYTVEVDIEPVKMPLDIVFEDEHLMVINKPSGLVVHPGSGNRNNTLVNGLMYYTKDLSDVNSEERPGIVHRIDKDTSGLLLVAKTNEAHVLLADYFKNKEVKRKYLALLDGVFPHTTATIDAPIGRDEVNRKKMAVTAINSKKAVTHLSVVKRYDAYTLASFILDTGRTHQIRVHAAYIGYPVHNDPVYANKSVGDFGQFLHSSEIEFVHPITKEFMHFKADLPSEFQAFIDELDKDSELYK